MICMKSRKIFDAKKMKCLSNWIVRYEMLPEVQRKERREKREELQGLAAAAQESLRDRREKEEEKKREEERVGG